MTEHGRPSGGPTIIEPMDFRRRARPKRARLPILRTVMFVVLAVVIIGLGSAGWFVLTARRVQITFEPIAEDVQLSGSPLHFRLADEHLLRPGTYTVQATRSGYHPLDQTIEVDAQSNSFHFQFEKLPGLVSLQVAGADRPDVPLDEARVVIDGSEPVVAPLTDIELEPGEHTIEVRRDRYQAIEEHIDVEGLGNRQTVALEMRPDWADVEISTSPVSADLWIDGAPVAATPCVIELASGPHTLELRASGYQGWQQEFEIVAEVSLSITNIELAPLNGILLVQSNPPGAQVIVDGEYAGVTPVELETEPDQTHIVRVARGGHEPAECSVRVRSAETEVVNFDLTARYGTIHLDVTPNDADLLVDGEPWGDSPNELHLSAIEHQLEFTEDGYRPQTYTITPRAGLPQHINVTLRPIVEEVSTLSKKMTATNGYPLVLIQPTAYTMGSSRREQGRRSNETLRSIQLQRPFYMGEREVTNAEFHTFMVRHRSGKAEHVELNRNDQPVVQVTWDDAARFCNWLSAQEGLPAAHVEENSQMRPVAPMTIGYRLPTEAEWEYCARMNGSGGALLKYPWGASYPPKKKTGNFADESAEPLLATTIDRYDDGYQGSAPVGSFPANALGMHDLGGNVAEWCHDFYMIYLYDDETVYVDPVGPKDGRHHVVRGSSWRQSSISALRFSYRDYCDDKRDDLGFRICRYLPVEETNP